MDENTNKEISEKLLKEAFLYHYNNNKNYNTYTKKYLKNDNDQEISNIDIKDIPLIPSSFFKKKLDINTTSYEDIIKYCTSSGTLGNLSIVPRDEETLLNFYSSIAASLSMYFDIEREGDYRVVILGPDTEEAGDLWFSYVLSSMALNFQATYVEKNGVYLNAEAYQKIKESIANNNKILIIGPPFRFIDLCDYMLQNNLKVSLPEGSFIISAGGWKNRQKRAISRDEFTDILKNIFNIHSSQVRDSFNMVELNTVISECSCHQKHLLPWMDAFIRDPLTNEILEDGQEGIISYYDASSLSYPCFILSEDYGIIHNSPCECGLKTKRIEITRRMNRVESRGCSLKMAAGKLEQEEQKYRYFTSVYRKNNS